MIDVREIITCIRCGKKELRWPNTKFCLECKKIRDKEYETKRQEKRKLERREAETN